MNYGGLLFSSWFNLAPMDFGLLLLLFFWFLQYHLFIGKPGEHFHLILCKNLDLEPAMTGNPF